MLVRIVPIRSLIIAPCLSILSGRQLSDAGGSLKCLTIIDEFTRESLAIDIAGSIRSARVIEVLARLISEHGAPRYLRSDNGPEFVSKAILE
jgi:transposase InsO family protein